MIFMNSFFTHDNGTYNMSMVLIYILVLTVAFVIAVIISNKLNVYNNKAANSTRVSINTVNGLKMKVLNETAAATECIRGTKDEQ